MRLALLLLAVLLLLPIPSAAAGGGGHGGPCAGLGEGTQVTLLDNCFNGTAHFVGLGDRITVTNNGTLAHTYTAVDGSFDSGTLQPGTSTTLTVPGTGTIPVYCTLHSSSAGEGMAGVLVVGQDEPVEQASTAAALPPLAGFGAGVLASAAAFRLRRTRARTAPAAEPAG